MENTLWPFTDLNAAGATGAITSFSDPWRFFSNFWAAPVTMYGVVFPTNEHAFVAAKSPLAGKADGKAEMQRIAKIETPGKAKREGRKLTLRDDWETVREDGLKTKEWVLLTLARRKFSAHPALAQKLLASGDRLILEGNEWGDRTWGVINTTMGVQGANRMGLILMSVREELGGAGVPSIVPASLPRYTGVGL